MNSRVLAILAGGILAGPCLPGPGAAQSEYHWSDQFGNKSTLLNGTVIGGVSDLGAVFYNPGRLAQLERPGFLLTAAAFEVNKVMVREGSGNRTQIEQANLRGIPSLVAGMFALPSLPGHRFAYSFLNRRKSASDLQLTAEHRPEGPPGTQDPSTFIGTWESVSSLEEDWVGFSWAYEASPRVSVGVTTFGTYLGRTRRISLDTRALDETGEASTFARFREYRFRSYGLLWKAGVAAELNPFRLGLSLTSPQITALGAGSIRYDNLSIPPASTSPDPRTDEVVVFQEDGLKTTTRSPFSVGAGLSWIRSRAELHLSLEWFSGISPYRITGSDSIPSQSSAEVLEYHVVDELEPVFNLGAGIEWQVSDAFSVYGSIISDASAAPGDTYWAFAFGDRVSNSDSQPDGFHLGAGVSLEARWIDLTAGLTYGSTTGELDNPLETARQGGGEMPFAAEPLEVTGRRLRFLLGFTIPMVEEITDGSGGR